MPIVGEERLETYTLHAQGTFEGELVEWSEIKMSKFSSVPCYMTAKIRTHDGHVFASLGGVSPTLRLLQRHMPVGTKVTVRVSHRKHALQTFATADII